MLNNIAAFFKEHKQSLIYAVPAVLVCLALQMQLTFFKTEDYLGIRLNLADLMLPVIGLLIMVRLILRHDRWPHWTVPFTYFWLAGLSLIMTVAVLNGYKTTGEWQTWALINKYIGWFVLVAYFAMGGWIARQHQWDWQPAIIKSFLAFWICSMLLSTAFLIMIDLGGNTNKIYTYYPLAGFMGNRNAYAFLSFSMLALLTAFVIKKKTPSLSKILMLVWAVIPIFYIYNASRAGLVVMLFIMVVFSLLQFKFSCKHILLPFLIGSLAAYGFFSVHKSIVFNITQGHIIKSGQLMALEHMSPEEARERLDYIGDKVRMHTYTDAFELWKQHPLFGGGLGAFRDYHTEKRGTYSDVIDFTGLWLLAETGAIGLTAFSAFFLLSLWQVFKKTRQGQDPHGFYMGLLMVMMIFAIMSLVHELLYSRFLWFLMGLGLACTPMSVCNQKASAAI